MARIIKRTLFEKLAALPALQQFLQDFRTATGLNLSLCNDLGSGSGPEPREGPICRFLATSIHGRRMCLRTQQELFASAVGEPVFCRCDAGMHEVAVPLRVGDNTFGYFSFGGTRPDGNPETGRSRHLLGRAGIDVPAAELEVLFASAREVPEETLRAYARIVAMAAMQFVREITEHILHKEARFPALAQKAIRFLRAHALCGECDLKTTAKHCGVTEAHLSRAFQSATGLSFSEYLARYRVEHATRLLISSPHSVTEIAFESGFGSISQFNRTFKKLVGKAPSEFRRR